MKNLAIIGPIDERGKAALHAALEHEFHITEVASEDEYPTALAEADAAVLRTLTLRRDAIEAAPRLKLIQRWGAGYDSVDTEYAAQRGIPVMVASGTNAVPVAEYAIGLMLAVYRNLISVHAAASSGKGRDDALLGRSYVLSGKKAGLVGLGRIGKHVASILNAFGASVCYYDPFRLTPEQETALNVTYMPLEELARQSDVISLHVPLTPETQHLFDADMLSVMKPEAILINTSRGGIVDEAALTDALRSGRLLGAALDVFEDETPEGIARLADCPNLILSAHCAGNTTDNSTVMADRCAQNILHAFGGGRLTPPDLVNGVEHISL